jgi:hypothetical protein
MPSLPHRVSFTWTCRVFVLLVLLASCARSGPAGAVPKCSATQLLGYVPKLEEVAGHRHFSLPSVSYAFGTKRKDDWGLALTVRVDRSGRVVCYRAKGALFGSGPDRRLSNEARAAFDGFRTWIYDPFVQDGHAVDAIVSEEINERERPEKHVPLPEVAPEKLRIVLRRSGCFGSCPDYSVEIRGDGSVLYEGVNYVDVPGKHGYQVSPADVAKLVDSARAIDFWSLRSSYRTGITDNPTYLISVQIGEQEHHLEDYVGKSAGMPSSVTDFEQQIDVVARSREWLNFSSFALQQLKREGYDFKSPAGAELLARAVANDGSNDNQAMADLLAFGAPIDGPLPTTWRVSAAGSVIEEALLNQRELVIDPLIAKGALQSGGQPDQAKIDAAFRAAIRGGRLMLVQKIWQLGVVESHPALTFDDVADDGSRKQSPVTLLLVHQSRKRVPWEGMEIARWLGSQGCDLRAAAVDGTTLLHIAAEAGDVEFVRFLLNQGMSPSTPGRYGLPAPGSVESEEVAIVLLEAGTDLSHMSDSGQSYRSFAEYNHWRRVVQWLSAHHQ